MDEAENEIEIIPAVNVYRGTPVLKGNRTYKPIKDSQGEPYTFKDMIGELSKQFEKIFITDLNGITRDKPQLELFRNIPSKTELWVDSGSRYSESAIDVIVAGASKVVLGTKTLIDIGELKKTCDLSENVILGIDYDDKVMSPDKDIRNMNPSQLAKHAIDIGIGDVIFTDMKHLSSDSYFSLDVARTLPVGEINLYYHGKFEKESRPQQVKGIAGLISEVETIL